MNLQYLTNMRGIAILLIVLMHATTSFRSESDYIFVLKSLLDNSSVLFVTISGFLFSTYPSKRSYKSHLATKLTKVMLPYVIVSTPAILMYTLNLKNTHYWLDIPTFKATYNFFEQYLFFIFTGAHLGPLWFIPMIAIFFLLRPVFAGLNSISRLLPSFLLALLVGSYYGRPEYNENILMAFVYFLPAYLFGMLLALTDVWRRYNSKVYGVLLILMLIVYGIAAFNYDINSHPDLMIKLVMSFLAYGWFSQSLNSQNSFLNLCAQLSFFIFLVHGYFFGLVRDQVKSDLVGFSGLFVVLFAFIIVTAACIGSFFVAKLVLRSRSRYIIGG